MKEIPVELMQIDEKFELADQRGVMTIRPVDKPNLTLYPGTFWEYSNEQECWTVAVNPEDDGESKMITLLTPLKLGTQWISSIPRKFHIYRYDGVYRLTPVMGGPSAPRHFLFVYIAEAEKPWKLVPEEEVNVVL